jgi:ABC-2 type transport system permease protein
MISGEYGTGMILLTLTATPRRSTVLVAKAIVLTGLVLAGRLILPGHGFTPAHGYPLLSLADGAYLRAAAGSVLYLALVGLLGLGIATAIRDSAAAIGVVLGVMYLFPVVTATVSNPRWQRHLEQIAPMSAGLAIQATTGLRALPISPCVLAAWTTGAMLAGGLLLQFRDT